MGSKSLGSRRSFPASSLPHRLVTEARRALRGDEKNEQAVFLGCGRDLVSVERGLFCLGLAFVSKFPLHIAIMEWLFLVVASIYIARGIAIGVAQRI